VARCIVFSEVVPRAAQQGALQRAAADSSVRAGMHTGTCGAHAVRAARAFAHRIASAGSYLVIWVCEFATGGDAAIEASSSGRHQRSSGLNMEGTEAGLAAAAATRETLSRKRKALSAEAPKGKKVTRPPPTCTHEVARPEGWQDASLELDESIHGEQGARRCPRSAGGHSSEAKRTIPRPSGTLDNPVFKGEMAKEYPFTLDPFQSTSIACLVRARVPPPPCCVPRLRCTAPPPHHRSGAAPTCGHWARGRVRHRHPHCTLASGAAGSGMAAAAAELVGVDGT
jgi:hypothetical protein